MALRFTAALPPYAGDAAAWRDDVRRIEDLGFHAGCISDHLTGGWVLEPVAAMGAALAATSTLRVHSLVLGNDFRHPVLLHKALATLDAMSGGRVGIGLGAGWLPGDYDGAGFVLDPAPVRIARLAEAVQVLRGLFGEEPLTFVGEHYRTAALAGLPRPTHAGGPPILVGGGGRAVVEVAGQYADAVGINPRMSGTRPRGRAVEDLTRDRFGDLVTLARDAAAAAGRTVEVQLTLHVVALDDVPGVGPWTSSLAVDADPAFASPAVLRGPVGACAERLLADAATFGIDEVHVGGDPRAAAALMAACG